ncbi:hypothetical protein Pint_30482 [Pistacia integerrima]|uniref:Uncharacterized protein n=1 Tax=Pistacia integerrima TaxID=434235 RepID=A0ACC0WYG1_9ROSI|nr:hypothetical protein Pint_30482 [Pistacia integerrima]
MASSKTKLPERLSERNGLEERVVLDVGRLGEDRPSDARGFVVRVKDSGYNEDVVLTTKGVLTGHSSSPLPEGKLVHLVVSNLRSLRIPSIGSSSSPGSLKTTATWGN